MPAEWGGMGLGHVELAMVQAEAAKKSSIGPWVLNCQAPDEGNMHTLLHWGPPEQKEKYLKPLCEGTAMSCFAMTEPEVAGSDPTLIQTPPCRTATSGSSTATSGSSPTPAGPSSPS
jgi:acyl-CoA dehydrogenase